MAEPVFTSISRLAAEFCSTPIAHVSVIDAQRQWSRLDAGPRDADETPQEFAFCEQAIQSDQLLEVPNALADPRFAGLALVAREGGIRFYAGAPLVMPDAARIGVLCVTDRTPRRLTSAQAKLLRGLAQTTAAALAMRAELLDHARSTRSRFERQLAESEALHRALVDNQVEMVSLATVDGTLTYVNRAYAEHFGVLPEAMIGKSLFDHIEPQDRLPVSELIAEVLATGKPRKGENRMKASDGSERWVAWTNSLHQEQSGPPLLHSVGRDVTKRRRAEQQAMRQTGALRSVIEAIPAIVAVVGSDLRFRIVNSGCERWLKSTRQHLVGRQLREVLGAVEYQRTQPWIERALRGESVSFEKTYHEGIQSRHLAVSYVPLRLEDGSVDGFVSVAQDITQHRQEEVRLLQLSQRDPLTGLLNRSGVEQFVQHRIGEGAGATLACLCIDLDHFKPVNDEHGHPVGDALLQAFAQRLSGSVRPSDAVARLGGDEFAVVLRGIRDVSNAQTVAENIVSAAREPFSVGALSLKIGASVGIAVGADRDADWSSFLKRADQMLYQAKRAGRGRHVTDVVGLLLV